MEIIGTNVSDNQKKTKKLMIIITIIIVILLIISLGLFVLINYLRAKEFKFEIDGKSISSYSSDTFIFEENKVYVSLKDISSLVGYKYYNGGYKQYTEDSNKCYLESNNEVTTFETGLDRMYKTPIDNIDYTYYTLQESIQLKNGKLYINSNDLGVACNLQITYNADSNKIDIYTLPYLVNYYSSKFTNAVVGDNFNNQKALLYGLLVVGNVDGRETKYGVNNLQNEEIIGMKYAKIEFIEGSQEFIVTTEENKVGLITSTGDTRVNPQYDSLKQIDKDLNLYLATNNNSKGIIETNGKILIYLEYDEIGVDTTQFQTNDIKNRYILFDNAIPVKQNNKWGLFDIKGNLILPVEYSILGCVSRTSTDRNLNNILIVPEIEGIVVGKEIEVEGNNNNIVKTIQYGIVNSTGRELVRVCLDNVYSTTVSGKEQYTMVYQGQIIDIIDYIRQWGSSEQTETTNANTTNNSSNNSVNQTTNETVNQVVNEQTTQNTNVQNVFNQ